MIDKARKIEEYFEDLPLLDYMAYGRERFPVEDVARYIYLHNRAIRNPKRFKKLNIHFYININEEESKWLQGKERKFVEYKKELAK